MLNQTESSPFDNNKTLFDNSETLFDNSKMLYGETIDGVFIKQEDLKGIAEIEREKREKA